jgi:L-idonate 5-dehydrogenase
VWGEPFRGLAGDEEVLDQRGERRGCARRRGRQAGAARVLPAWWQWGRGAARFPHVQGGFAELVAVRAEQLRPLPPGLEEADAVLAEPLAVALHAAGRAGPLAGKRALVTGAGPIGLLVIAALRHLGVAEVVASDILEEPLARAARLGATATVVAGRNDGLPAGEADVAIEASGSPSGLQACIEAVRPGGAVVALGIPGGAANLYTARLVTREVALVGSYRFGPEFDQALTLLASGFSSKSVVSHSFMLEDAEQAFELASDRAVASKVVLRFTP